MVDSFEQNLKTHENLPGFFVMIIDMSVNSLFSPLKKSSSYFLDLRMY